MAISPNVLAGVAAALSGGLNRYNEATDRDEDQRRWQADQDRQSNVLARAIARDELADLKTTQEIEDKQFDNSMVLAQQFGGQKVPQSAVAKLPAHLRDLISSPAEQTLASRSFTGYSETAGAPQDGAMRVEKRDAVGPGMVSINMPESEKARIAQANATAAFQRAQLGATGRDADRDQRQQNFLLGLTTSNQQHQDRLAATYAGIAARQQNGGRSSSKFVLGRDADGNPIHMLVDSETGAIIQTYDKPLTHQERTAQNNSQASLDTINDIAARYKDEYVGQLQGRANNFSTEWGIDTPWSTNSPEVAEFAASVARYKNKMINKITGAAVGVAEEKRIMGEIPDMTNPPTTFKARLKLSQDNEKLLDGLIARRGGRPGTGGGAAKPATSAPSAPTAEFDWDPVARKRVPRK